MHIQRLVNNDAIIKQLAAWHVAEWAHLYSDWDEVVATSELQECAQQLTVPAAWTVSDENGLQGSVSLLEYDALELSHYAGPWLASLYVQSSARGRGYGSDLVKVVMQHVQEQKIPSLRLFTPEHEDFYKNLGWTLLAHEVVHGEQVSVMEYRCIQ